ncbi:DUF4870 domain-containing protein [Halopseudomonas formosensis]|uniref:DUF4870 domain-containing protein n=1 Tax=Halopseudomonas formosensis TaxID=1002526 RepID=A0ABU5BY98_9GAMM|nr:DUF4870 domain-containing protein [Halopseudomonas formosensis]MDX9687758.1 DUF4870 domain-containing protein [Halopseudomonas formosensis]
MVDINQPETGLQEPDSQARMWAMIAHLAGFLGYFLPVIGSLIGPLIVWQLKKDTHPYVDEQGKEALNFQITVLIAALVCVLLMLIAVGFLLIWVVAVGAIVLMIIAAIKANEGAPYRYPFCLRLIK